MKTACKSCILTYVVFFFLYFFSTLGYADHVEVYMNPTLGLAVSGPPEWYMEMKDNPSSQAKFAFENHPALFVLFSKYDFKNIANWPNPFGSVILVYVFPPVNASAMTLLDNHYNKSISPALRVIELPHEVKLNNQLWAVMVGKKVSTSQGITLYQVTYFTLYANGIVQIEAAITEKDYPQYRKLLDQFVSQIIFDSNKDSLMSKVMLMREKNNK